MAHKHDKWAKKPLYRKVNTVARHVHHNHGTSFKRNIKDKTQEKKMLKVQRGLDYTPLYRFLLSKAGEKWATVHSEAIKRLDTEEALYHIVYKSEEELEFERTKYDSLTRNDYACLGESSYYSTMYVDKEGILQIVNKDINHTTLEPSCKCCTHTFNGKKFSKKYISEDDKKKLNIKT